MPSRAHSETCVDLTHFPCKNDADTDEFGDYRLALRSRSRASKKANPALLQELTENPNHGKMVVKDGHWQAEPTAKDLRMRAFLQKKSTSS